MKFNTSIVKYWPWWRHGGYRWGCFWLSTMTSFINNHSATAPYLDMAAPHIGWYGRLLSLLHGPASATLFNMEVLVFPNITLPVLLTVAIEASHGIRYRTVVSSVKVREECEKELEKNARNYRNSWPMGTISFNLQFDGSMVTRPVGNAYGESSLIKGILEHGGN